MKTYSLTQKTMHLTNEKLYELCKQYGAAARLWRQKFIGLLPEVNKRCLYEEKGFSSIFEFAAKLCGLSAEQVRLALNLEKRFEDKPVLKRMLENGEASINKLTRIASIATVKNEEELAEKVKILPINALNTLVRDEKRIGAAEQRQIHGVTPIAGEADGSQKPLFEGKGLYVQTSTTSKTSAKFGLPWQTLGTSRSLNFQLSEDVAEELNELNIKGIDVSELLREALKRRREEIAKAKEEIAEATQSTKSRYIPVKTRQLLKQEHGKKCSIATCQKPAKEIHHSQRFSLSQNHNPKFLAPLCHEHHVIAHSIDVKYHRARPQN